MNSIEVSPSKILRDAPVIIKVPKELVGSGFRKAQLSHARGTAEVLLREDKEFYLAELNLGEVGEYQLQVGTQSVNFHVNDKEDLSFAGEFWVLAICVGVLFGGFILWDKRRKKLNAGAGSF